MGRKIYKDVLNKFGITAQTLMLAEECSELIKAASKLARFGENKEQKVNLIEEIADVQIMCEQMMTYYNVSYAEVNGVIEQKLKRLERILNEDEVSNE